MYANDVYKHTPAEIQLMFRGAIERNYDELERLAYVAIMNANAMNTKKRIKASDLFKRPTEYRESKRTADDIKRDEKETMEWLSRFEEFSEKIK